MTREPEESRAALDLIREVGGDALVRQLLATFLKYADEQMARAVEAATTGDAEEIARLAHAMKSSGMQLGASAFSNVCAQAEVAGLAGRDVPAAVAGVAAMQRELAAARIWMEAVVAERP